MVRHPATPRVHRCLASILYSGGSRLPTFHGQDASCWPWPQDATRCRRRVESAGFMPSGWNGYYVIPCRQKAVTLTRQGLNRRKPRPAVFGFWVMALLLAEPVLVAPSMPVGVSGMALGLLIIRSYLPTPWDGTIRRKVGERRDVPIHITPARAILTDLSPTRSSNKSLPMNASYTGRRPLFLCCAC